MSALDQALATIRERIDQHQGNRISEEAAKTALVNPLLRALGWDTEDLHQVYPEYSAAGGRVDYALFIEAEPRLLIEAKALDVNLDDLKWATQLTVYAVTTGVRWAVLTNGDEYRIYNAYAEVPIAEKLFHTVRVSEQDPRAAGILSLLSRGAVLDNRLDARWQVELEQRRRQRVNQQLQATLQALVDEDPPNEALVRLLRNQPGCQLAPGDIREGLRRARVRFELPLASETALAMPTPRTGPDDPPQPPESRQRVKFVLIKSLLKRGIIQAPLDIHMEVQGRRYSAVIGADGRVLFQGQRLPIVNAMQAARRVAAAASPEGLSLPANVWDFWRFTDADGQIKPLGVLRQRFLEAGESEARPSPPGGSRVLLGDLIAAGILNPPLDIHTTYKGPRLTASIEADGAIVFQGNRYKTPSGAGSAVRVLRGAPPNATVNGWSFWQFTDAEGRDQPLSVLRDRYLEQRAAE